MVHSASGKAMEFKMQLMKNNADCRDITKPNVKVPGVLFDGNINLEGESILKACTEMCLSITECNFAVFDYSGSDPGCTLFRFCNPTFDRKGFNIWQKINVTYKKKAETEVAVSISTKSGSKRIHIWKQLGVICILFSFFGLFYKLFTSKRKSDFLERYLPLDHSISQV